MKSQDVSDSEWKQHADRLEIRVDNHDIEQLLASNIANSIVSLYSSFDDFLSKTRKEFQLFHCEQWKIKQGDSPIDEISRNLENGRTFQEMHEAIVGFEYYRKLRNKIVHPASTNLGLLVKWYEDSNTQLQEVTEKYSMKTAPNAPDNLEIHDMKLFCRILLDIAEKTSTLFDPGDVKLAHYVESNFVPDKNTNKNRQDNAYLGYIATNFGVTGDRARQILQLI